MKTIKLILNATFFILTFLSVNNSHPSPMDEFFKNCPRLPLYRVLNEQGHVRAYIIGTVHTLSLSSFPPEFKEFLTEISDHKNQTYPIVESFLNIFQDDNVRMARKFGTDALLQHKKSLPADKLEKWGDINAIGLEPMQMTRVTQTSPKALQMIEELFRITYFMAEDDIDGAEFTQNPLRKIHPTFIHKYVKFNLAAQHAYAMEEDPQDTSSHDNLDMEIRELFRPHVRHLHMNECFETQEEVLEAIAPEGLLKDKVKFGEACDWFSKGCPVDEQCFGKTSGSDLKSLLTAHPTLSLTSLQAEKDYLIEGRNQKWEKKLEEIVYRNQTLIPVAIAGMAHMGGESGIFKMFQRLYHNSKIEQAIYTPSGTWTEEDPKNPSAPAIRGKIKGLKSWIPVDMSEKWFSELPETASEEHKKTWETVKTSLDQEKK